MANSLCEPSKGKGTHDVHHEDCEKSEGSGSTKNLTNRDPGQRACGTAEEHGEYHSKL